LNVILHCQKIAVSDGHLIALAQGGRTSSEMKIPARLLRKQSSYCIFAPWQVIWSYDRALEDT